MFRLERRDRVEADPRSAGERVADRERPGIRQADDVAGERHVDRFAIVREELHRARQPHVFSGAHVAHRHVALEASRADARERDAVAMARVHVRLDLEDERREALVGRFDAVLLGIEPRRRAAGPSSMKRSRNSSTPKFVTALPKKTGVTSPRSTAARIEVGAGAFEQLDAVDEFAVRVLVDERADPLVGDVRNRDRRALRAVLGAFEDVQFARLVRSYTPRKVSPFPSGQFTGYAPIPSTFSSSSSSSERIARRAVHLVDEGEERDAPRAADRKQLARLRFYAFGRVDQHHRAVGGEQRAVRVFAEVLVTRAYRGD